VSKEKQSKTGTMAAEKETKKEAETKLTDSTSNEKPTAASPSTVPAAAPAPAPVSAPSISEPKPSTPAVESMYLLLLRFLG